MLTSFVILMIIWDEAPMAKRQTIETVDRSFKDIMDIDKPFGGKVMVVEGDYRQVLPVVPKSTRAEIVNASLVKSYLWPLIEKIQFTRNMRVRTDPTFSEFLLRVGNGDKPIIRDNLILLPEQLTVKHSGDGIPEESIIKEIFPNLQENVATTKYVTERAILASRNDHVDKLNDKLISMFPRESKIFNIFDSLEDDTNNYYQEEYLNALTPNGLLPHRLELKENAPIMMLRNLDPSSGLCNGTRMICRGFSQNVLHAEISSGTITPYTYMAIVTQIINSLHIVDTNNITLLQISGLEDIGTPMQT
ncbi:hypothetical protein H5410_033255 [Solanum commersonii]|uniref:ATP-dependent DNA helicase n=1 Tax=Solanum commersonii TaxID=4109 RepID=A0A9J5YPM5_SOLCO|nr:hypothetical protein H5410_033255 [Solanum commersonii]